MHFRQIDLAPAEVYFVVRNSGTIAIVIWWRVEHAFVTSPAFEIPSWRDLIAWLTARTTRSAAADPQHMIDLSRWRVSTEDRLSNPHIGRHIH
jgi:hypothetical protein